jgi:hypothetical protein
VKGRKARDDEQDAADSARMRLLTGPILAATAAEAWLGARASEAVRGTASQPGGPVRTTATDAAMPAWIEAGARRILGAPGAPDRATSELRADEKAILPLASLFAVRWPRRPNATDIARLEGAGDLMAGEVGDVPYDGVRRARGHRDAGPGASSVFMAQSVSVLAFIHERDPSLVARLADATTRGESVESVLASSTALPHDVAALDAQWRKWLKSGSKRQRR